jgi:hypothetical protein
MYWSVVPGFCGRGARHPVERLKGTGKEVVVVGGVVVIGDDAAAETVADANGTTCATANTLTKASAGNDGSPRRQKGRARRC